ncbi:YIP1 family protein [Sporosarcina sp. 179-K 8C2 HS]|uniref:YIP1 family protein n=1 Tax=Sporosarcina sp. 179-K 8C2 HS TaxID=3142387 RepID=UPI0039A01FFA
MKPLISIWSQPTKTLQYLLEKKSVGYGFLIFLLSSISTGSIAMATAGIFGGMPLAFIIIVSIIMTYGGSLIGWVINTAMYTWVGKWLGGTGKFSDMIHITPAPAIVAIWLAPMNFLLIAVYGSRLFEMPTVNLGITNLPLGIYFLQNLITIGVGIFGTVIACKGIGLVHGFSAWRGLGVVAIIIAIFFVIVFLIALVFGAIIFSIIASLS